jgi:pilus assembly protein FimV
MIAQSLQLFLQTGELEGVMREYLFVAQSHLRNGEVDESEAFYRQIMTAVPGEVRAIKGLVSVAEARSDRVGQIDNLLLLGRTMSQSGDTKGALKAFRKVNELDLINEEAKGYLERAASGEFESESLDMDSGGLDVAPMEDAPFEEAPLEEAPIDLGADELEEVEEIEDVELLEDDALEIDEGMELEADDDVVSMEFEDVQELELEDVGSVEMISEDEMDSIPDIILEDFDDEVELVTEGDEDFAPLVTGDPAFADDSAPAEEMTVDELLSEAEVYQRYGLADKMMETLEIARTKAPDDPKVLRKIEAATYSASLKADPATAEDEHPSPEMAQQTPSEEPVPTSEEAHGETGVETFAEDLEEAEFYMSQGLEDEAHRIYRSVLQRSPNHPVAMAAVADIEGVAAPAAAPPAAEVAPVPEPAAVPAPPVPPASAGALPGDAREVKGKLIVEDSLIEDADGFLDLADELRTELADEFKAPAEAAPEDREITFEEIFSQFKKGIEETLGDEEYETHYNLGIAYKDMGLYDDALTEFEMSSRDPDLTQDSLSLMAMCFVDKKDLDSAVKAIQKAMEISVGSVNPGLFYQLGETRERQKMWPEAVAAYEEVLSNDATFEGIADILARAKSHLSEDIDDEVEADEPLDGGMDDMLSDLIKEVEEMAKESSEGPDDDQGKSKKDRISYV